MKKKKYPDKIRTILQTENQFSKCQVTTTYLYPQMKGRYFAMLDGDDYWIDENKLQCQVDFLEQHKDYSMCYHNAIKLNNETGEETLLNTFSRGWNIFAERTNTCRIRIEFSSVFFLCYENRVILEYARLF